MAAQHCLVLKDPAVQSASEQERKVAGASTRSAAGCGATANTTTEAIPWRATYKITGHKQHTACMQTAAAAARGGAPAACTQPRAADVSAAAVSGGG